MAPVLRGAALRRVGLLAGLLTVAFATPSPAMAIEKPAHRVVERHEGFELREYPPYLVAETVVEGTRESAGNDGFRRLAGYIFGKNKGERRIDMTAPVAQAAAEPAKIAMTAPVAQVAEPGGTGRWVIQFMMPASYTLETLPAPLDPAVTFRQLPARRVAALTYSGTWSAERYQEHLERLLAALARAGLGPAGEPVWARYDPPFMPWFLRTNEILVEVRPLTAPATPPGPAP